MNDQFSASVDDIYGTSVVDEATLEAALTRSLNPRRSTMLYDKFAALGVSADDYVLDIGCRDAAHSCELARRCGCQLLGIDPVAHNIAKAEGLISQAELGHLVQAVRASIEAIPANDASFDYIWCRDMLNHVPDLAAGLRECVRVLKPGGQMLIYQTFATDLLEPNEAAWLFNLLSTVPANMSYTHLEQTAQGAGFTLVECDVVGSEWREWWEESGDHFTAKQLLTIARLRRDRERLIREIGRVNYEVELGDCHWGVYQMLGKLQPRIYLLAKA